MTEDKQRLNHKKIFLDEELKRLQKSYKQNKKQSIKEEIDQIKLIIKDTKEKIKIDRDTESIDRDTESIDRDTESINNKIALIIKAEIVNLNDNIKEYDDEIKKKSKEIYKLIIKGFDTKKEVYSKYIKEDAEEAVKKFSDAAKYKKKYLYEYILANKELSEIFKENDSYDLTEAITNKANFEHQYKTIQTLEKLLNSITESILKIQKNRNKIHDLNTEIEQFEKTLKDKNSTEASRKEIILNKIAKKNEIIDLLAKIRNEYEYIYAKHQKTDLRDFEKFNSIKSHVETIKNSINDKYLSEKLHLSKMIEEFSKQYGYEYGNFRKTGFGVIHILENITVRFNQKMDIRTTIDTALNVSHKLRHGVEKRGGILSNDGFLYLKNIKPYMTNVFRTMKTITPKKKTKISFASLFKSPNQPESSEGIFLRFTNKIKLLGSILISKISNLYDILFSKSTENNISEKTEQSIETEQTFPIQREKGIGPNEEITEGSTKLKKNKKDKKETSEPDKPLLSPQKEDTITITQGKRSKRKDITKRLKKQLKKHIPSSKKKSKSKSPKKIVTSSASNENNQEQSITKHDSETGIGVNFVEIHHEDETYKYRSENNGLETNTSYRPNEKDLKTYPLASNRGNNPNSSKENSSTSLSNDEEKGLPHQNSLNSNTGNLYSTTTTSNIDDNKNEKGDKKLHSSEHSLNREFDEEQSVSSTELYAQEGLHKIDDQVTEEQLYETKELKAKDSKSSSMTQKLEKLFKKTSKKSGSKDIQDDESSSASKEKKGLINKISKKIHSKDIQDGGSSSVFKKNKKPLKKPSREPQKFRASEFEADNSSGNKK